MNDSMRLAGTIVLMIAISLNSLTAGWHDRKAEGWAWYEDRVPPKEQKVNREPSCSDPVEEIEAIQKTLEEKKALAILEPTEEHILDYIREQNKWTSQSHKFANVWISTILKHPELDFTLEGVPVSQYGQKIYRQIQKEERNALISSLSEKYALLFLYEGKNPASKEIAKAVSLFSKRYSWVVSHVSVDGVICEDMPNSTVNTGLKEKMGISIFPTIAVVCPDADEVIPIGYGFVSVDMIESNIEKLFSKKTE